MANLVPILLISIIGLIVDCIFIKTEYAGKMLNATILKGVASAFFVALGVYCYRAGEHANDKLPDKENFFLWIW